MCIYEKKKIDSLFFPIYVYISMYTSFVVNSYATCVRNAQYTYMDRIIFSLTGMWVYVGSTSQDTVIVV
jgi:hypothetical protein